MFRLFDLNHAIRFCFVHSTHVHGQMMEMADNSTKDIYIPCRFKPLKLFAFVVFMPTAIRTHMQF